jgi:hypothetical protein
LVLLGVLSLIAVVVGVVQGVGSPGFGAFAALITAGLSAAAAFFACGVAALSQPCPGPGDCDTAAAVVAVPVGALVALAMAAACSAGWFLGWMVGRVPTLSRGARTPRG